MENIQKFIAQILNSKLPVRSAEDVDKQALSYAEIKALATGNPLVIEKRQLEMEVNKLKILHASHLSQKYALEDKILKENPKEAKRLTERIAGFRADIETVSKHPTDKDHFPPMTIGWTVSRTRSGNARNSLPASGRSWKRPKARLAALSRKNGSTRTNPRG